MLHDIPHREYYFAKYLSNYHAVTVFNKTFPWKKKKRPSFVEINTFLKKVDLFQANSSSTNNVLLYEGQNLIHDEVNLKKIINEKSINLIFNHDNPITDYIIFNMRNKLTTIYDFSDYLPDFVRYKYFAEKKFFSLAGCSIIRYLMNKAIKGSDIITAATLGLYKYAQKSGAQKVDLLSNFVDCDMFRPLVNSDIRKKYHLEDSITFGYVGRVWHNPHLVNVLKALSLTLRKYDNVKFFIVGDGKINFLKQISEKFHLNNNLIFTGFVPYENIPKYVGAMDVCFLGGQDKKSFTWKVGRPRKLFEYMACAKPVISSPSSELKIMFNDLAREKRPIFFALRPEDISKIMILLIEDRRLRINLGRIARGFIYENYHWIKIAEQLRKIIEEIEK